MPNTRWSKPVEVRFGVEGCWTVTGPFDALIYLNDMWPDRSGARFIRARNACKGAVEGRLSAEDALKEFLAAAEEAKLNTH